MEPEYITFNYDDTKAYIALQVRILNHPKNYPLIGQKAECIIHQTNQRHCYRMVARLKRLGHENIWNIF